MKAPAPSNTAPQQQRKVQRYKKGVEKKEEERALFKNRISANTKGKKGKTKQPKKDLILERGGKRTVLYKRHFPDLPFGEITIEGSSRLKHCTTQQQRKVQ